jgi:HSP20 family protein
MSDKLSKYEGGTVYYPSLFRRLFDEDFFSRTDGPGLPAVNVKENKTAFKLEVSAPGFEKKDFDLRVDKHVLTISATKEHTHEEKGDDEKVHRREFHSSSFQRSFTLPQHVDTAKIEATEKNGVLTIKLPKKADANETTVKKIEIK